MVALIMNKSGSSRRPNTAGKVKTWGDQQPDCHKLEGLPGNGWDLCPNLSLLTELNYRKYIKKGENHHA